MNDSLITAKDFAPDIVGYLGRINTVANFLDMIEINKGFNAILSAYERGGNIYIFGNGGSAATASHLVCDFNKGITLSHEKKFNLICLNDSIPMMMAIANDIGYEDIFLVQLECRLKSEDLIVAISGSGNSPNVIKATEYAKICGVQVVGMTGYDGGKLKTLSDYSLHVPINDMQIAEDFHMMFGHMMMQMFSKHI